MGESFIFMVVKSPVPTSVIHFTEVVVRGCGGSGSLASGLVQGRNRRLCGPVGLVSYGAAIAAAASSVRLSVRRGPGVRQCRRVGQRRRG